MNTNKSLISTILISMIMLGCSSEKKANNEKAISSAKFEPNLPSEEPRKVTKVEVKEDIPNLKVVVCESKEALRKYYELPFIKEFYDYESMAPTKPKDLLVPDSLSDWSYGDLRLLRNEVFARNGYLFGDGFLRGYFNKFNWYMPIFDVDTFKVVMSKEEQKLVNRLLKEESIRKEKKYVDSNGLQLYNADLIVNTKQFKSVEEKIRQDLSENNFSIVNANRQMPFYIYDKNAYQYVPNYITTDLYLFILHKYFSSFLEKLDENFMSTSLNELLTGVIGEVTTNTSYQDVESMTWVEMYAKTALYALTGTSQTVPHEYTEAYQYEEARILGEEAKPAFIKNNLVSYSELKPRGHYTKSERLKRYFKSFKWISLNGIDLANDEQLKGMISLAYIIKSNDGIYSKYKTYVSLIERLAGQEDNVSIRDVIKAVENNGSLTSLLSDEGLSKVRSSLSSLNKERIKTVFGKDFFIPERDISRVYFLSSTYSVSGEIFSRLIHVNDNKSKRPFPRGLDIPAVFGNETAQNIILKENKDGDEWPEYEDKLVQLQKQFLAFEGWNSNYGVKGLKTALASTAEKNEYPDFMKTNAYNRKELSTMLSSWTHIKHDLVLYQEKPSAAEAGQGGGPEPPKHYSYVEANMEFWKESLDLARWMKSLLKYDDSYKYELKKIIDIGLDLEAAAIKQQRGEKLTLYEQRDLSRIGGRIEYTLLGLLETDHLSERDKSMALIADVYSYNGTNLNVAVGHADDIYVVVPINNEYHIARGSVFSYYEFQDSKIYNDEEWRKMGSSDSFPERPNWIAPLINNLPTIEGQMEYRYSGYGAY